MGSCPSAGIEFSHARLTNSRDLLNSIVLVINNAIVQSLSHI